MYVEPCCVDRVLPSALKQSKGGFAFFTTNGDITVQKLMGAVSSLAGSQHRMTLVIPEVDVMLLREIRRYIERGWSAEVNLLTRENQEQMVGEELSGYLDRVTYAADPMVIDGLLAFENIENGKLKMENSEPTPGVQSSMSNHQSVVIMGAMLAEVDFSFSMYAGYYGSDTDIIDGALKAVRSKLKLRTQKKTTD